jgi:L-asparaginase / beta-aspartyl-peptidase
MEKTEHALLAGEGANQFAEQMGVETAPDEYFFTEHRWLQFQEALAAGRIQLDHTESTRVPMGTVGAVACDRQGHLASGTSTGGMTNKKFGRVGDSALIGAGTFANETCAVSCTGHGEFFMLGVTAYDVAARMKYAGQDLVTAARESIDYLRSVDGEGGLIAVDAAGNVALSFNSQGMYRGYVTENGEMKVDIYGD